MLLPIYHVYFHVITYISRFSFMLLSIFRVYLSCYYVYFTFIFLLFIHYVFLSCYYLYFEFIFHVITYISRLSVLLILIFRVYHSCYYLYITIIFCFILPKFYKYLLCSFGYFSNIYWKKWIALFLRNRVQFKYYSLIAQIPSTVVRRI